MASPFVEPCWTKDRQRSFLRLLCLGANRPPAHFPSAEQQVGLPPKLALTGRAEPPKNGCFPQNLLFTVSAGMAT